jgi:hypothetical protein
MALPDSGGPTLEEMLLAGKLEAGTEPMSPPTPEIGYESLPGETPMSSAEMLAEAKRRLNQSP